MQVKADICIITALRPEAQAVVSGLKRITKTFLGLFSGQLFRIGDRRCLVMISGIGVEKSYLAVKQAARLCQPSVIMSFGTAGSLSSQIHIGELVSANQVLSCKLPDNYFPGVERNWKGEEIVVDRIKISEHGQQIVSNYKDIKVVSIGSFNRSINSGQLRTWLNKNLGLSAADRETFGVLKAAQEEAIPALSLRVIADSGGDDAVAEFYANYQPVLSSSAKRLIQFIQDLPA